MCDYSLEAYRKRDAQKGDRLVLHTFGGTGHGTKGFVDPADPDCAVCIKPGTRLEIGSPAGVQRALFVRRTNDGHRDALLIEGHQEPTSLQILLVGTFARVLAFGDTGIRTDEDGGLVLERETAEADVI